MKQAKDYYPITTRVTPDGDMQEFITPEDLADYTKPKDMESLNRHLRGSTSYIQGIYIYDVERWLNNQPNND